MSPGDGLYSLSGPYVLVECNRMRIDFFKSRN